MSAVFSTWGALAGLVFAIVLIIRRMPPVYALVAGAIVGGFLGGGGLAETVTAMISGTQAMMPSVLRILASGILVGALVQTGSAARIADAITAALGERFALAAIALATAVVTAVGVFIDIAVITVAPVALAVGRKTGHSVPAILLAMIGGGKAGNVLSPNPNTIAVAEAFKLDLTEVMFANLVPALCALVVTVVLAHLVSRRTAKRTVEADTGLADEAVRPGLVAAALGPLAVVGLLMLRPLAGFAVDPLVALPIGGIVTVITCRRFRDTREIFTFGLGKVTGVAVLLVGTGTVAGIVKASALNSDMIALLSACHLPVFALAPLSSILLSGATASTTAGVTIAGQTFAGTLVAAGVPGVSAAAMLHAGGTIFDALPHGSFFHATAGAVGMSTGERLRLFPYGTLVGATTTLVSVLIYLI